MNNILTLLLISFLISCQEKKDSLKVLSNMNGGKESLTINTGMSNQKNKEIRYIDFKQNPAEEYYFTRKYRLTKEFLFYFQGGDLIMMSKEHFNIAKKIIENLPVEKLNNNVIGHETVIVDVPDWTIEVHFEKKDTIHISSGGLPYYLEEYRKEVWNVLNFLDNSHI